MKRFFKFTAIAFLSPALLNLTIPSIAKAENQFDVCLREIVNSGIDVEQANTACADALIPKELSFCVQKITNNTAIAAEDALTNCYQVRRPVDLGNCVVDIDKTILQPPSTSEKVEPETAPENIEELSEDIDMTENSEEMMDSSEESSLMLALDTCRSSLSPARHSECVIGLSRTPQPKSPEEAMETCIKAEDFPRDLFPDY